MLGAIVDCREYIRRGHEEDSLQGSEYYLPGRFQCLGSKICMIDVNIPRNIEYKQSRDKLQNEVERCRNAVRIAVRSTQTPGEIQW